VNPYQQYPPNSVAEPLSKPDGRSRLKVSSTYGPSKAGWKIVTVWAVGHLRPEIEELTFIAPAGELTPSKIKALPLSTILGRIRAEVSPAARLLGTALRDQGLDGLQTVSAKGPRRGRELSSSLLQEVAAVYHRANSADTAKRTSVTAAVSEHFNITPSTAKKRIMAARAANYLPPRKGNTQ
jgi:hypothetical protein